MNFKKANQSEIEAVLHVFSRLDIENEENVSKYTIGILDVYSYTLSEEEASVLLSSFEEHNLKYEEKFIAMIKDVFYKNEGVALVYFSQYNEDIYPVDRLGLHCNFTKEKEKQFVKIDNLTDLEFVIKLSTRELFFSNFFFMNIKTVIIGNYELSFPVYCANQQDFTWISNEAQKHKLFIRR